MEWPPEGVAAGTVIAGRYRVLGLLGKGGMGVVYQVEHLHTGEQLALKVLLGAARFDPQALSRFKREARAAARIRSEHVVRVTDADTSAELGGTPFIVMELLRGSDLERHVVERGALPPEEVVLYLTQVGRALELAHRLGIVHRDLKPENLFLHQTSDGGVSAKVLDFGISKFVSGEGVLETGNMTSTGSVLGTPLYMSPEQAHGYNDKIGPTTDVWAMGLVALRLLTADNYWGAPTMADLMMKLVVKPMVPPSERWPGKASMSAELDAWFARSCARDQEKRWPSIELQMTELAVALGVAAPTVERGTISTREAAESITSDVTEPLTDALAATAPAVVEERLAVAEGGAARSGTSSTLSRRASLVGGGLLAAVVIGVGSWGALRTPAAVAPAAAPSEAALPDSASAAAVVASDANAPVSTSSTASSSEASAPTASVAARVSAPPVSAAPVRSARPQLRPSASATGSVPEAPPPPPVRFDPEAP